MFGRKSAFASLSILFFAVALSAKTPDVQIVVEPYAERYKISVSFKGDASGTTKLRLPSEWGGQRDLYKSISGLTVSPASATLAETAEPHVRSITHKPGERLTVTYELAQGFEGQHSNAVRYRPVVDKSYIHWIGNAVWAVPDWNDEIETKFSIRWRGFPKDWSVVNSFGVGSKQKFTVRFGSLRQAVFVAGDFRMLQASAAGKPVNVAIRGKWNFADTELSDMIGKIIEVERAFWNDHSQESYLVTLVPIDGGGPNSISTGGTGLTDSFALFATSNARLDLFRRLLAHEYFHNWNSPKLGHMPKDEAQLYWFSEGFTDFYTYELLRRGGLITLQEYADRYNELIREYYSSPVRTAPNDRIAKDFWNDPGVQRLPYLRGFLFATNLNAEIKKVSGGRASLDDAMRELFAASKAKRQQLSFESLAALFAKHLGRDASPVMRRHLIDGELIAPLPEALGEKFSQDNDPIPVFELGFDFEKFAKDRVVAGLDPNSSAYAAGLRDGQRRNGGVSFSFGDTSKEIELRVKDDAGEKVVKFLPVARERRSVAQYKLR